MGRVGQLCNSGSNFFCIVAAIALVVQVVILTMLFFQLRKTTEKREPPGGRFAFASRADFDARAQILLDDTQPKNLQHGE